MSLLSVRQTLAAIAAGGALAATGILWASDAHASPDTDFLTALNYAGIVVYDTRAALNSGYAICSTRDKYSEVATAEGFYRATTSDVPDRYTAAVWVVAAEMTLCPWHYVPQQQPGFVA